MPQSVPVSLPIKGTWIGQENGRLFSFTFGAGQRIASNLVRGTVIFQGQSLQYDYQDLGPNSAKITLTGSGQMDVNVVFDSPNTLTLTFGGSTVKMQRGI
jgi:hypothetical protein